MFRNVAKPKRATLTIQSKTVESNLTQQQVSVTNRVLSLIKFMRVRVLKACQFLIEQNSLDQNSYVSIVCNMFMEWVHAPLSIPAESAK